MDNNNKTYVTTTPLQAIQNVMMVITELHEKLVDAHKENNHVALHDAANNLLWISEFINIDVLRNLVDNSPKFRPTSREIWNKILNDIEMLQREANEEYP